MLLTCTPNIGSNGQYGVAWSSLVSPSRQWHVHKCTYILLVTSCAVTILTFTWKYWTSTMTSWVSQTSTLQSHGIKRNKLHNCVSYMQKHTCVNPNKSVQICLCCEPAKHTHLEKARMIDWWIDSEVWHNISTVQAIE